MLAPGRGQPKKRKRQPHTYQLYLLNLLEFLLGLGENESIGIESRKILFSTSSTVKRKTKGFKLQEQTGHLTRKRKLKLRHGNESRNGGYNRKC